MVTRITLSEIKKSINYEISFSTLYQVAFVFNDENVSGSITVPVPLDNVTDADLVIECRKHLREVFLRLADEVIRPQDLKPAADVPEATPREVEEVRDPSETASEVRAEQIAAAKLLIAVKFYANGSVPGAELLPTARQDTEGVNDMEHFTAEVTEVVLDSVPNGNGGANRFPNLRIAHWLICGSSIQATDEILSNITKAISAVGNDHAKPQACQRLWTELKRHAR